MFQLPNMTYYALIEQLGKGALSKKLYIIEIYTVQYLKMEEKLGNNFGVIVDNFELAYQLDKNINDAVRVVINERNIDFF